jgi:L-alanine-DL-glutamate epimerase-like enolase superfamily enzyme
VQGADALRPRASWIAMQRAARNAGTTGIAAMAISAVDNALWDLAARLLGVPLVTLLGQVRDAADVYGSGGFCSYDRRRLQSQLAGWAEQGIPRVKMKVGRAPEHDLERVAWVREAIGPGVELFVDANGAYDAAAARAWASRFAEAGITWLEEPVPSDDPAGLARVRSGAPPGLAITAGEYGWDVFDLLPLVQREAVDVLQPDVTRCGGYTAFLRVDGLCRAHQTPLSAHCAPAQSMHAVCASQSALHLEYFHDHVRVEALLFDGVVEPGEHGRLAPDRSRPGNGLELRRADAQRFAA